ncbi:carboxylesterase family protein [Humisphaera borealis]|uniref:Phospholipase n=1 Tax=Humisphaera borealis TaxID=2807512 RepID=A0A7M2X274_9BACT|nr:hypothetical protein [Humisphaera borealis]QOV91709.1 phospholipase [Humisphaera borealis]
MRVVLCSFMISALVLCAPAVAAPSPGQQTPEMYDRDGEKMGYLLYLPADYKDGGDKKWPVILFLHSATERGDGVADLEKLKKHGPPKLVGKETKDFIVIAPQSPPRKFWDPKPVRGLLLDALAQLKNADADRVYLTGTEMGGFTCWSLAARNPDLFAAVAPVCAGGLDAYIEPIKHLPIRAFEGDKDISLEKGKAMVEGLKKAGAKSVELTVYPDSAGREVGTKTYTDPGFYGWLLKQSRPKK